jgi:hypothetical protein
VKTIKLQVPFLDFTFIYQTISTQQAFEIGAVSVFSGAHSYQLPTSIGLMDYQYLLYWCKPFNVKVGEAKIYD